MKEKNKFQHNDDGTTYIFVESEKHGNKKVLIDTEVWGEAKEHRWNIRLRQRRKSRLPTRIEIRTSLPSVPRPDGSKRPCGRRRRMSQTLDLHMLVMKDVDIPKGHIIKRLNGDWLDCRRSNLKVCGPFDPLRRRKDNNIKFRDGVCEIIFNGTPRGDLTALVDAEDWDKIKHIYWRVWNVTNARPAARSMYLVGYQRREKKDIKLHHLIMGKPPEGMHIDHINHDGLDNRKDNLRLATHAENMRNSVVQLRNKVGFKGVRIAGSGFFQARIHWRDADRRLLWEASPEYYTTPEEAALAYNSMAIERHGKFAGLNDVEGHVRTPAALEAIEKQSRTLSQRGNGRRRNKVTGYYGVKLYSGGRYEVRTKFENQGYYWGLYGTPEEAAAAYDENVVALLGPVLLNKYAPAKVLNFPEKLEEYLKK